MPTWCPQSMRTATNCAGIRLPDISVPLATYTGWNVRHPDIGGPGQTLSLLGSTIPFPATQAERQATGDPRPSIEERYASKEDYLRRVQQAAEVLVQQGYLLAEDLPTVTRASLATLRPVAESGERLRSGRGLLQWP